MTRDKTHRKRHAAPCSALAVLALGACAAVGGDRGRQSAPQPSRPPAAAVTNRAATTPETATRPALPPGPATDPLPAGKTQLLMVISESWSSPSGALTRYQREPGGSWTLAGDPIRVVLGRSGYGWGDGLHGRGSPNGRPGPLKREGDGRSPAGAFALGKTYGYAAEPQPGARLPYVTATDALRCVDDPASGHYNRIVSRHEVEVDWASAEHMLRRDGLYEHVIEVEHNQGPVTPGNGSCIFVHVWAGPDRPTSGCTAMMKPALEQLLAWLEPGAAVLVGLPESEYAGLQLAWGLP